MIIERLLAVAGLGTQVVLYGLVFLSVCSLAVVAERWWYFRRRRFDTQAFEAELLARLRREDVAGARELCAATRAPEAAVIDAALGWWTAGVNAVREILEKGTREQRRELESGLVLLGTVGNNAPFVGLFGTVLGIVTAFRALGENAALAGNMGNVMSAIGEALVATAIGILVALPAVAAFNVFQKKTLEFEDRVAALGHLLLAELERRSQPAVSLGLELGTGRTRDAAKDAVS